MQILRQLGGLFLDSVPTIVLFLLFYWFLRKNFFEPLDRTLAARNALIDKARREAEAIQAAAQEKSDTYEEALRKARAGVFDEQEATRQTAFEERARLLGAARQAAQERVRKEKGRIAGEFGAARAQLEEGSTTLAQEIAQRIFVRPGGPRAGAR